MFNIDLARPQLLPQLLFFPMAISCTSSFSKLWFIKTLFEHLFTTQQLVSLVNRFKGFASICVCLKGVAHLNNINIKSLTYIWKMTRRTGQCQEYMYYTAQLCIRTERSFVTFCFIWNRQCIMMPVFYCQTSEVVNLATNYNWSK